MNTNTGALFHVSGEFAEAAARMPMPLMPELLTPDQRDSATLELARERADVSLAELVALAATEDEREMVKQLRAGEPIVPVSEEVAQRVMLGGRELERRKRRAKAARKARRTNR